MMTATVPDTDTPCKTVKPEGIDQTLSDKPVAELNPDGETEISSTRGSIVILINLSGGCSVQIIADRSDDEDTLRQWLTIVEPVLEVLRGRCIEMVERTGLKK